MQVTNIKLVTSRRNKTVSPVLHRRNKLIDKIHEQILLVTARKEGTVYAPKRLKTVINKHTGERATVESVKRVKEWYWTNDAGKINLAIKYGAKTLQLNKKGANAVEVANGEELLATLQVIKQAVAEGELDDAITEVSSHTREGFTR